MTFYSYNSPKNKASHHNPLSLTLVKSTMLHLGKEASDFLLKDVITNNYYALDDLKSSKAMVIMFICNHCPYVIHLFRELVDVAKAYKQQGVSFVAINSNDVENYPEDSPDKMSIVAKVLKFSFPYLYDKNQEVAKAYDAACTPDFYIFDGKLNLQYRGRFDGSRPGSNMKVTGEDLTNALDEILSGKTPKTQYPSMGCNIKWKN